MRWRAIAHEAWANVLTQASRPLLTSLFMVAAMAALALLDSTQVAAIAHDARQWRDTGGATYLITQDEGIDGVRCESLAGLATVRAAGALRFEPEGFTPLATPRTTIPVFTITPGLATQLAPSYHTGIALDSSTADGLGVQSSQLLTGTSGRIAVSAIFRVPDDGRDQRLSYALTRSGPAHGAYDQCWLAMWPPDPDQASLLLRTSLLRAASADSDRSSPLPIISRLNPTWGESFTLPLLFDERTGRSAVWAAVVIGVLVAVGLGWLRRLELSFARHLGMRRSDVALILTLEALLSVVPVMLGAAISAFALSLHMQPPQVWPFAVRVFVAGAMAYVLGVALVGLTRSERRVFDHFKSR